MFKLSRRHAAILWSVIVSLTFVTLVLTVSVILIARERDASQAAAQREHQAALMAQRERRLAEAHFRGARDAVDHMFSTSAYELADVAGSDDIRHALMEEALHFYEGFVEQKPTDKAVRYDLAIALDRLAEIHFQFGMVEEAERISRRAHTMLREFVDVHPENTRYRQDLAENLADLAAISLATSGSRRRAEAFLHERIELLSSSAAGYPNAAKLHKALADAHADYARVLGEMRRFGLAERHFRESLDLQHQMAKASSGQDLRKSLVNTHHGLGAMLLSSRRFEEAADHLEKARAICTDLDSAPWPETGQANSLRTTHEEMDRQGQADRTGRTQVLTEGSRRLGLRHDLASVEQDLAELHAQSGDFRQAERHLRRALAICDELVGDFPSTVAYAYRSAACQYDLFRMLSAMDQPVAAVEALTQSTQQLEWITENSQGQLRFLLDLARNYCDSGLRLSSNGDVDNAANDFRRARQILQQAVTRFPEASDSHAQLAWFLSTCPELQYRDIERAAESARLAVEYEPENASHRRVLGAAQYRLGEWAASIETLTTPPRMNELSTGADLFFLALAHLRLGGVKDAVDYYERAVQRVKQSPWNHLQLASLQAEAAVAFKAVEERPAS